MSKANDCEHGIRGPCDKCRITNLELDLRLKDAALASMREPQGDTC